MPKTATLCFTPITPSASVSTQTIHIQTVGLRAPDPDTIMHGVAEAGLVRAPQWQCREHSVYMFTPLLALDVSLSQNITKRTRDVSSSPD